MREITKLVEAGFHEGIAYTTDILKVLSTKTIHQDFATNRILCEAIRIIADTIESAAKELRTCPPSPITNPTTSPNS